MRASSSFFVADGITLTSQAFVVSNVLATVFDCYLMFRNRNGLTMTAK